MASKSAGPVESTQFKPAPAVTPTPNQQSRNLTQERLETYLSQRKRAASKQEKPPKELASLDPAKRAAEMVGATA